jgi:hypothetical protein
LTNIQELVESPIISRRLNARISFPWSPISARNCFHGDGLGGSGREESGGSGDLVAGDVAGVGGFVSADSMRIAADRWKCHRRKEMAS